MPFNPDLETKLLNAGSFLAPFLRESFFVSVIRELGPGEGELHRALAAAQREFLRSTPVDRILPPPKHSFRRRAR
jgi:hypothetical protein